MKLPHTVTDQPITVEKLVPGGQGISTLSDGKKIFLWNVLPGEIVTAFTITKNKTKYAEGYAETIENPLAYRIAPKDSCFLSTSPWQIMRYDYELQQKQVILTETFHQNGLPAIPATTTVLTDQKDYHYRNKMEYALYWDNNTERISLAFHERGSHRKAPVDHSSIERPEILQKAQEIVSDLNNRHEEARKYQSLLLRTNQDGKVSGGLYENGKPHPHFPLLTDTILGQKYSYSPNGFFQINLPVYEMALSEIKNHITTDQVLDLYAGVGTIGLSVARDKQLVLVESNSFAFSELKFNCAQSNTPVLSDSESALEYIIPEQTVIVDPPRAGCAKKLLEKFLEIQPEKIIYLSCNPATQARDLAMLQKCYFITKVQPYNFFPHTPHLENLVILEKK